jgi:thiol-disulfide isomerase/thioredoxin
MSEQISPKQPGRRPNSVLYIFLIIPLLSVVAAVLTVTATGGFDPNPTPPPVTLQPLSQLVGQSAPNFELPDLDGNLERLSSYRGRVVFVNFWATWCEPCKREMPAFQQFMQSQPEGGPIILAVNASEPVELIQSFLDDYNVTDLPVLLDAEYQAQDAYNTEFYPITFVVDKGGIIQDQIRGELTLDDLNAYVARYE